LLGTVASAAGPRAALSGVDGIDPTLEECDCAVFADDDTPALRGGREVKFSFPEPLLCRYDPQGDAVMREVVSFATT
jgi:hypothetical protein